MKFMFLQLVLLFVFVHPFIVRSSSSSLSSISLRGVSPQDVKYYSVISEIIECKDGSKKINRSQLNDDFCDCPDGSDEPGTSACPDGRFYCWNAGHIPLVLFSSRVNDGICDCCDGSDEYDGKIKCPNTCWESGKVARDKLKKKIAIYQEGVKLRKKEIEQAKLSFAKEEAELSKLRNEEKTLKDLVQKLKEHKEQIEKAEEKELLDKEKEENLRKEAEKESDQESKEAEEKVESEEEKQGDATLDDTPAKENAEEPNIASDSGPDPKHEHETAGTECENTEGLSKEELGRLVASRWTGEKTDHKTGAADDAKDSDGAEETVNHVHEDEHDGYASDFDDNDHRYDQNDVEEDEYDDLAGEDDGASSSDESDSEDESSESDVIAPRGPSWQEKVRNTVRNLLQVVPFFRTPLNMSDAARVRKEYDESSAKLSKIQSRISTLSEKLKDDFGPEKEFYSLYDCCFETKQNKYVYKVCPFQKATQEDGYRTTQLGHWEKFEDVYKLMVFSNGDACWNGPDRSFKVKLRCGLKNELTDVDEPSRCEYVALLSTPSLCVEEKLRELQQQLDAFNAEPVDYDEL